MLLLLQKTGIVQQRAPGSWSPAPSRSITALWQLLLPCLHMGLLLNGAFCRSLKAEDLHRILNDDPILKDGIIWIILCKALPLQVNLSLPAPAKLCISATLNSTACSSVGPKLHFFFTMTFF